MNLRDYQQQGISKINAAWNAGTRSILFQLPTGGGKTVIFVALAMQFVARGVPVLVIVHRDELLVQAWQKFQAATDTPCGLIKAGYKPLPDALIQIASIQTLARRLEQLPPAGLVVVDETHHAIAPSYKKVLELYPQSQILGVTATPRRIDGYGFRDLYSILITCTSVAELIADRYLSQYRIFAGFNNLSLGSRSTGDNGVSIQYVLKSHRVKNLATAKTAITSSFLFPPILKNK